MKIKHLSLAVLLLLLISCGGGSATKHAKAGKSFTGKASWYGKRFHGRKTASGERYNMHKMTAAHKQLPFGTKLKVTNLSNNKTVFVRVNDRGPYSGGRVIDLSYAAAKRLGFIRQGTTRVRAKILR